MDMLCRLAFSKMVNRPSSVRDSIYKILFHGGEYWFLYVLFLMCIIWGTVQVYIKQYAWLQIVVGIGAVGINLLNISFDFFRVDSICKYFVFFMLDFDTNILGSLGVHEENTEKCGYHLFDEHNMDRYICDMVSEW